MKLENEQANEVIEFESEENVIRQNNYRLPDLWIRVRKT